MYLFDNLAAMASEVNQNRISTFRDVREMPGSDAILGIYAELMERMKNAPRFLLDRSVTQTMVELSLGRPKVLREAMEFVRVPYPRMWIEWEETHREKIRQTFNTRPDDPGRPLPERLGFLIECEEGGRRGTVTWAWTSPPWEGIDSRELQVPNIGPVSAYFDLDAHYDQGKRREQSFLNGNLAKTWAGNQTQLEALWSIWETAIHRPSEWGKRYLDVFASDPDELQHRIDLCFADVYGEYIGVWATLMILTSSRKATDYREINRAKINKARAKRREVPLLDHTEVVMHVSGHDNANGRPRIPLGHTRKSPRVHMVSRYLARRGDKHWLVEPYLRGSGDAVERHVHVQK